MEMENEVMEFQTIILMLMKIERVNDRQIRCTLSAEDLAKRKLKLSEFAYGSDIKRELIKLQLA